MSAASWTREQRADSSATGKAALTRGNIVSVIWQMSWPLVLTMLSCCIVDLVHVDLAGHLGAAQQAAVGLGDQIMMIAIVFAAAISSGASAIVARKLGEGQWSEATDVAAQALWMAVLVGAGLAVVVFGIGRAVLPLYSACPTVNGHATSYLAVTAWHLIPFSILCTVNAVFRGIGDARSQFYVILLVTVIDILLNYATVIVHWPVNGLGLSGVGWAAVIANATGMSFGLLALVASPLGSGLAWRLRFSRATVMEILSIGVPTAMLEGSRMSSTFVLFFILSHGKDCAQAIASWALGLRLEAFLFLPIEALALGITAIIAQNVGAREIQRAQVAGWTVAATTAGLMILAATVMFIFAEPVARAFTHDAKVLQFTADYLRINAFCEPFLALQVIFGAALPTLGDAAAPALIGFASNWILRLPMAAIFTLSLACGPAGAWYAMSASNVIAGIWMTIRFARNENWKSSPSEPRSESTIPVVSKRSVRFPSAKKLDFMAAG